MVDHLWGGRKSAHPGQRNCFVDTFAVFQVTKRPLVAAVQMVGAAFSLWSQERQHPLLAMIESFPFLPPSHPNTTPGGTHMGQRAAAVSTCRVPAAGVPVLTGASIRTNQRRAQVEKSQKQDRRPQSLNPGDRRV